MPNMKTKARNKKTATKITKKRFEKNLLPKTKPLALITGASSGIGFELAKVFADNNFDLIIVAEDSAINEAGQAIRNLGKEVTTLQINLASFEGVEELCAAIKGRKIDVAAINAGVGVGGEFIATDLSDEMNMMQLNVVGAVQLAKYLAKDFVQRGEGGKILFTSSLAAEMPGPYFAVYAATKAFIQHFSEALSFELKEHNITVTALQPGATDTNFFKRADMLDTKAGKAKKDDPAVVALDGYKALMAGKDHVVAGSFMNVVQSVVGKIISEKMGARTQGAQTKSQAY